MILTTFFRFGVLPPCMPANPWAKRTTWMGTVLG